MVWPAPFSNGCLLAEDEKSVRFSERSLQGRLAPPLPPPPPPKLVIKRQQNNSWLRFLFFILKKTYWIYKLPYRITNRSKSFEGSNVLQKIIHSRLYIFCTSKSAMESQYCFDNASMLLYSLVSISTVINLEYEKRALTFETKSYSCFECIPKLYVWTILAVEGEILKETNNTKIKLSKLFSSQFSSKIRIFFRKKRFINSNLALHTCYGCREVT